MGSNRATDDLLEESVHQFTVRDSSGIPVSLRSYKGKALLIVNVASKCGLTPSNYKELTKLHDQYRGQGFQVLAFPCNQFGGQEPGSNEEIQQFACTRFKAAFPIFGKIDVNGPDADSLYKFLKAKTGGDDVRWNFTKFLVDKNGIVVDRYAPKTPPSSIEKDIRVLLQIQSLL